MEIAKQVSYFLFGLCYQILFLKMMSGISSTYREKTPYQLKPLISSVKRAKLYLPPTI